MLAENKSENNQINLWPVAAAVGGGGFGSACGHQLVCLFFINNNNLSFTPVLSSVDILCIEIKCRQTDADKSCMTNL